MIDQRFSSGSSRLDEYIAGFLPGDSFLSLVSEFKHWRDIVRGFTAHAASLHVPLIYLQSTGAFDSTLQPARYVHQFQMDKRMGQPKALLAALKKFSSAQANRSYILVDEL